MANQHVAINPLIEVEALRVAGIKRAPYAAEVEQLLAAGKVPNVYVFAGPSAWQRANARRERHGLGSAIVLPDDEEPAHLKWPAVDAVVVCWPRSAVPDYRRRLGLAQALIRDGVQFATIENYPEWLNVWRKGRIGQ